jgi:hypothetical protein
MSRIADATTLLVLGRLFYFVMRPRNTRCNNICKTGAASKKAIYIEDTTQMRASRHDQIRFSDRPRDLGPS